MGSNKWAIILVAGLTMALVASPAWSQNRDSDGTRMQARQVEMGTTHSDSLAPPEDRSDWRMVRLGESTDARLTLTIRGSGEATVTLYGASGNRIEQRTAGEETASIIRTLDAGIYYIAVEASESLRYELSIR